MLALDHVVFAGEDIEAMSTAYGNKFNLKAVLGGRHENWSTYNYLAYLSNNTYLEWIGIDDEYVANQSDSPLFQHLSYHLANKQVGLFHLPLQTYDSTKSVTNYNAKYIPYNRQF